MTDGEKYLIRTWESSNDGKSRIYTGDKVNLIEEELIFETDETTTIPVIMDKEGNWYWITEKEGGQGYNISKGASCEISIADFP